LPQHDDRFLCPRHFSDGLIDAGTAENSGTILEQPDDPPTGGYRVHRERHDDQFEVGCGEDGLKAGDEGK
jgi:hypothetical protein